jgi:hypothetical protein
VLAEAAAKEDCHGGSTSAEHGGEAVEEGVLCPTIHISILELLF